MVLISGFKLSSTQHDVHFINHSYHPLYRIFSPAPCCQFSLNHIYNIYHTVSKLTDRHIPAPSVTASRTITLFFLLCVCECVFIGLVQVRALDISSHQLPLFYRSTSGGNSGLTPFSSTLVLPWLLGSGRRKVRHREELLSASPWQLRE